MNKKVQTMNALKPNLKFFIFFSLFNFEENKYGFESRGPSSIYAGEAKTKDL